MPQKKRTPTKKTIAAQTLGRLGGRARAAGMTAEERSEAARLAASAPRPSRRKKVLDASVSLR